MAALSNTLHDFGGYLVFRCPGCNDVHGVGVGPGHTVRWGWNGSSDKPTFTPSILRRGHKLTRDENGEWDGGWERDAGGNLIPEVCHSFVTDGRIQFLGDCTHALAGQTVDLPELPEHLK